LGRNTEKHELWLHQTVAFTPSGRDQGDILVVRHAVPSNKGRQGKGVDEEVDRLKASGFNLR
jgi:hypothetical protein